MAHPGEWQAPGENDKRSPCPALNTLANHGYLPRNGEDITPGQIIDALKQHLGVSAGLGWFMAHAANFVVGKNGKLSLEELQKHNYIEHDASLTREDNALGNNWKVNNTLVDGLLAQNIDGKITVDSMAKLRNIRYKQSAETNKEFVFGFVQRSLAFGEASMALNVLGNNTGQEIDVEVANSFFREEKIPDGWEPQKQLVTWWTVSKLSKKIQDKVIELNRKKEL